MCWWGLLSRPTSCLSWRESSYRVKVHQERGLLPRSSGWLVLLAAGNLLRQSRYVVDDYSTCGVFLLSACLVCRGEVALIFLLRLIQRRGALRLIQRRIGVGFLARKRVDHDLLQSSGASPQFLCLSDVACRANLCMPFE